MADARAKRDEARKLLARNVDPGVQRKAAQAAGKHSAANSFEVVAREWLAVKAPERTEKQHGKERDRLQNHAFPWIGKLPIADIGVAEIRPVLERVVRRGHLKQAHRLRFQLSRVFKYAIAAEYATRDPAGELSATLPSRRKQSFPTITEPEKVGGLLRAIDSFDGSFVVACALKLAPLLFVRPGELRAAEWPEFDFDHPEGPRWSIHPLRRKLRKAQKAKRRGKILAASSDGPAESRIAGHFCRVRGWAKGISRVHRRGVPEIRGTTLHSASGSSQSWFRYVLEAS